MAAYAFARIKRISPTTTAVHVKLLTTFGVRRRVRSFLPEHGLLFERYLNETLFLCTIYRRTTVGITTKTKYQRSRRINTKILGNTVRSSGPKHRAPRTVWVTIPDDVNYACMKCLEQNFQAGGGPSSDFRRIFFCLRIYFDLSSHP